MSEYGQTSTTLHSKYSQKRKTVHIISRFGCPCPIQRANKSERAVHQLCRVSLGNIHASNSRTTYFIRTGDEVNIGTAQEPALTFQVTSRQPHCHT